MSVEAAKKPVRQHEKPRGESCLNCESPLETRFCPHCGQENVRSHLSLSSLLKDFFVEIAYYDSKLWRTLRMLIAHPGRLSSEWAKGRRAKYVSPIKLYLWITFLFFVAVTWHSTEVHVKPSLTPDQVDTVVKSLETNRLSPTALALTREKLSQQEFSPETQAKITAALDKAAKNTLSASGMTPQSGAAGEALGFLRRGWFGRQMLKLERRSLTDEHGISQSFIDQIPKVMFLVLPLIAGMLKLLYWRQRRYFVEHVVFILHLHSFAFLVMLLPTFLSEDYTIPIVALWMIGYGFVAMLRFYRQPWWMTLLKGFALSIVYWVVLVVGVLLAVLFLAMSLPDDSAKSGAKTLPVSRSQPSPPSTPGEPSAPGIAPTVKPATTPKGPGS